MCGIAGIVSLAGQPLDTRRLKPMCDALAHRGPDDAGYAFFRLGPGGDGEGGYWCGFADEAFRHVNEHLPVLGGQYSQDQLKDGAFQLALGHRRLSIQDLSHYGHQPMSNADRRYWIVYNGEIYNYPALREELKGLGHAFRTRCDTEVILKAWEQWGADSLARLDGMFAFALYDRLRNRLVLARDRFGVKPLYYRRDGDALTFASEIKGILAGGRSRPAIDPDALVEYFTFQNLFGDQTLFQGVKILAPGAVLEVTPGADPGTAPRRFHVGFPTVDPALGAAPRLVEEVAEAFAGAVGRQLIGDVEVGSYLSGGMDSGSIVAVAGRSVPRLTTFTCGFDLTNVDGIEQGFDERKLSEQLSYILQTEHYDVVLHAGDMPAAMERIAWHMDDPRVGMCHQNWYAAKLASRFVKVCLGGAGGDELFAGYPWRYRHILGDEAGARNDEAYFQYWCRLVPPERLPALFAIPGLDQAMERTRANFQEILDGAPVQEGLTPVEAQLQRALHFEFKTFLHGLLVTEDRISMAHGMEARVPFLDNRLADLAWRIPPGAKLNAEALAQTKGTRYIESTEGKRILRQAMETYLPAEFTRQRKQGFSPPDENWFRGPSMEYIKSILLDRQSLERPWFRREAIQACLEEHLAGRRNHRLLIWSLLSFEWLQRHYC